jgi:hydroxymethylbilane synthase
VIRVGTRGSALALAQAGQVAAALRTGSGETVELVEVVTPGDRATTPIPQIGVGVFTSALRDALLAGRVDVAVHSYKDLPTAPQDGLVLAAVPERADPRDVLVSSSGADLADLPAGASVGTGAPRRVAQLAAYRTDLTLQPLRGNIDTRVAAVTSGRLDAVVIAAAGLQRLGLLPAAIDSTAAVPMGDSTTVARPIDVDRLVPAPAQGALAVECRADDVLLAELLSGLDHHRSRAEVVAERALLAALEAGCTAPVGALANVVGDSLTLTGVIASVDGATVARREGNGMSSDADGIGQRVAADLLAAGVSDPLGSKP